MNWLNNMKIRSKLIFGFGLVLAITAFIAIYGVINMSTKAENVELMLDFPIQRYNNIAFVSAELNEVRRIVSAMAFRLGDTATLNNLYAQASRSHAEATRLLTENMDSIRTDPQMAEDRRVYMLDETQNALNLFYAYYDYVLEGMFLVALNGTVGNAADREQADYFFAQGVIFSDAMQDAFNTLLDGTLTTKNNRITEIESAADTTINTMTIFAVIAVVFGAAIAFFIARVVTKPVNEVVGILESVSNGNFSINMKSELTRDEIGTMTQFVYGLINVIRSMVDDISSLTTAIVEKGDIDFRIDASHYRGGYGEMMSALNNFTESYVDETMSILDALTGVSKGDFNARLKQLPGKKAVINQSMDDFLASLKSVSTEINAMIESAAVKGDMRFAIDAQKYEGDWRKIAQGLNDIAKAVNAPVEEIMNVMNQLSRGDFSNKVSGNYAGDFLQMKDAVNATITNLSGYITEISDTLTKIADGDLTISISREYVGSFVAIKDALNNISKTLHKTMSEISSASEQVLSGAKQISSSAMDLANGASTQASSIEELNASVDLINQQTQANAKNAGEANDLSVTSTSNAREGNDAMQQTLSAMNQIKDASNNISKIIRTIQDIAFQTNLLALNAAVEAARAGEHGRGFAVVAEEVRSLAARSQTAASETTELIGRSINTVETGSEIAQSTAETLDTIVDNANKVLNIVSAISNASVEQAEAISQVGIGLNQISQVVQSNSAVSEEAAAASEELTSQAELLQQLVAYFKV